MRVQRRTDLPVCLDGATEWSNSPIETTDGLLTLLNGQPALVNELVGLTSPVAIYGGRPRMEGKWAIAYLAFVTGREPAIRRWHRITGNSLWHRCGFAGKPPYDTTHHHFALLEEHADAFRIVAGRLIARAVEGSGGQVGRDIHVDSTEAETNARLYHDCGPDDDCAQRRRRNGPGSSPAAKAPTPTAQEQRQAAAGEYPDQPGEIELRQKVGRRSQFSNGCWYRSCDPTAGSRVYGRSGSGTRFWHGFYNLKAIDHFTGAVIATDTISATTNEEDGYPVLLNAVIENTGNTPRAVVGDRGFSLDKIYKLNTTLGIGSVFPWRKHPGDSDREMAGTDDFDQHGIPLCKRCGAPGQFESFAAGNSPRLWFECSAGCGRGSVVCSKGWRYLVPLWRDTEAYMALRETHSTYEKAHWRWRDQWLVGPDNPSIRPRRRGVGCHGLRAQAAMLLEWLLVCYREGWLGTPRLNVNRPRVQQAAQALRRLLKSRHQKGLHLPPAARPAHLRALTRAGP